MFNEFLKQLAQEIIGGKPKTYKANEKESLTLSETNRVLKELGIIASMRAKIKNLLVGQEKP